MATSPRPGVIQLDHPNMYMAAKEAQKDDWVRRGIGLAGDFLQERNRDIRYRRAKGKKDDRNTTEDSLKKLGEGAWGLLKAPFTDEAPMAPTVTEDYRTEVGEKKTSPLPEGPSDVIDRPEQILNAPKTTTEVDGLTSTQTAEPGVKVSFPMTVAGSVERSKLPDTVVPKPVAQTQAPTQGQSSVPQGMLQSPDWSEMFRLDPKRAAYDWNREQNKIDKQRAADKEKEAAKQRTQGLLKEVAAEFANIDPMDQVEWDTSRARWIEMDPNLANFIPAEASQNSWDRVQNQGGLGKNVAPKGEFAKRKYVEDQVKQLTFLSQAARGAGNAAKADFYANKALALQASIEEAHDTTDKTPEQWVEEYSNDIAELKKNTTKDRVADTTALFSKLSKAIGSGATLDAVKSDISRQLEAEMKGKRDATDYSDDELKEQVANYNDIATKLKEDRPKINGAVELLQRGINAGAAGMSSKTLQGDVLAEAEITRYISGDEWNQWKNKIRAAVGLAPSVRASLVADLVNALVTVFNKEVDAYNDALGTNKYKVKLSRLPLVNKYGKTNPPPGGEGGSSTGKTGGFTVKKRVQ